MDVNQSLNTTNISLNVNMASLEAQAMLILDTQFTPALICCIIAIMAIITNILIMVIIAGSEELHNKSQYIIFCHSLAEMLYALANAIDVSRKMWLKSYRIPDIITSLNCIYLQIPWSMSRQMVIFGHVAVVTDRLLAMGMPVVYKNFNSTRYVTCLYAICWGCAFVSVPFLVVGVNENIIPVCNYALAANPAFRSAISMELNVLTGTTVGAYGLAIGIVVYRYWIRRWNSAAEKTSWFQKVQIRVFKMMVIVGAIYLVCMGGNQILISVLIKTGNISFPTYYNYYCNCIELISTGSHLFVYYGLSSQFRQSFRRKVFRQHSTAVVPLTNT